MWLGQGNWRKLNQNFLLVNKLYCATFWTLSSKKRTKKRKVDLQATREENPEMAELAASLQISHFQRVCQHINYKYLQQVNCHKMKVVLAIKKHFYFFLRFQKDCLFQLQFSN